MRSILVFLLSVCVLISVQAQETSQLDSLKTELELATSDSSKVDLLNSIGFATINIDLAAAEEYTDSALILAILIKYPKGRAFSYSNLGIIAGYRGQKENSFNNYFRSLAISDSIGDLSGMARIHNNLAINYDYLGDKTKALEHVLQAKDLYEQAGNNPRLSTVYNTLGTIYEDLGRYEDALIAHLQSLKLDRATQKAEGISASLLNVGNIYSYQRSYDQAQQAYQEALEIAEEVNHQEYISIACSSLAKVFKVKEDYQQALKYQQRSLDIAQAMGKKYEMDMDYNGLGEIYVQLGLEQQAMASFQQALSLSRELENQEGISIIRTNLGTLFLEQGKHREAIEQLQGALSSVGSSQEMVALMNVHQGLVRAYQGVEDFRKAFEHQLAFEQIKDSLVVQANSERILALQSQFEMDQKDQEIALLTTEKDLQETTIKQQSTQRNLLIVAVISMLAIAFLLIRGYRSRIKTRDLLYEKSREFQQQRTRFFTNISHEFRTPLTLIGGPLTQLRSQLESPGAHEQQLDMMDRNVERLQRLTNQILDLSKLEEGQLSVNIQKHNLSKVIRLITATFQSLAESRAMDFSVQLPTSRIANFDADILEKILYNLLSNAFKFTPEAGKIQVAFNLPLQAGHQSLGIEVSDSGQGMSEDEAAHVFDRFYQTERSIKSETEGTGIGLALCKELLDLVGGTIAVTSYPDKGTTFYVNYPVELLNSADQVVDEFVVNTVSHHEESDDFNLDINTTQILIVEDNQDLRQYIRECLGGDYQFIEAVHGKEGLEQAQEHLPDIIVSDLMMPQMNGIELCQQIKSHTTTAHIPFIMLTAKATQESKIAGLESGADDYIYKPFDPQEIKLKIRNLLEKQSKLREKLRQDLFLDPTSRTELSAEEKFLDRLKSLVEQHLQDTDLSVDFISREMGLSRVQLFRKLKTLTGYNASEFIRTLRLKTAAQLMTQQWGTVSDIAYQVGFNNLSYFSKSFKQEYGKTPSQYLEASA